jgi:DNA-binding GntR family transcriptional regulator
MITSTLNPAARRDEMTADGMTLHEFVANALTERIRQGEWAVGAALPSESSFCKFYGVSRHTLRHALATLEENGLILRRQGAPTRVISRQRPRRFIQSFNSPADILRYSASTYRVNEVEEHVRCEGELQTILQADPGSSWYHIGGVRREHDTNLIVSYSDIYILPEFADLVNEPDHANSMVYEQIERRFGVVIDRAAVDIFATGISAKLSKSLQVPRGAPCLCIIRRYFDAQGKPFEVTVTHHPESRFVFNMEYRSNATKP